MSQEIKALLFGTNLPNSGKAVDCYVDSQALCIKGLPPTRIHFDDIKAEVGGFDHDHLQLHWQGTDAQNFMLSPADADAQKLLVSQLPADQVTGMSHWKKSTKSQSTVWKSLWYGAGLITLCAALIVWQYDRVLDFITAQVSLETEKKLGDSILQSLKSSGGLISEGAAVDAVASIGKKLTSGSRYQYRWFIIKDSSINAFAAPGGIVVVNSGLLKKADSANELAGVLAHEVQHVEQRHALKNMLNSAGVAAVALVVLGDASTVLMVMAHQVSTQFFSRQVEAEADEKGLALLAKKQMQREGMPSFFKKIAAEYKDAEKMPAWLSSHPDTLTRIQLAESYIKKHPCPNCVAATWDKTVILADLKNRFKKIEEDE
jgi:beta-barrel assembly-enhancing protease